MVCLLTGYTQGFQPEKIYVRNIQLKEGLSQVVVTDMAQDAKGFIWISTFDGLNRFDGNYMKVFRHNPEDPSSLPSSKIHKLHAGNGRFLYLLSSDGFYIFDTRQNQTIYPSVLKKYKLSWVLEESESKVWFHINGKGLLRYNSLTEEVLEYFTPLIPKETDLLDILSFGNKIFSVFSNGDVLELDDNTGKFQLFNFPIPERVFTTATFDKYHQINLGSISGELYQFLPSNHQFQKSPLLALNQKLVAVNSIQYDSRKNILLLSSYGQGLFVYDYSTSKLIQLKKNEHILPIAANYCLKVFADRSGFIYLGYDGSGLDVFDPYVKKFVPIVRKDSDDTKTIKFVRKIAEDDQGNLIIGTAGSGLVRYTKTKNHFEFFSFKNLLNLSENYIIEMIRIGSELWLGFNGNGIAVVDLNTLQQKQSISVGPLSNQLSNGTIWSFLQDHKNRIWVGTRENGLNMIDSQRKVIRQFTAEAYPFFKNNGLRCLYQTREGIILIGTEKGIYQIDEQFKITRLFPQENSLRTGTLKSIKCFHQDYKGRIWTGTDGGGIAVYTKDFQLLRTLSTNDFLNNNVVYSILAENDSSFWISTNAGLSNIQWNESVLLKKANPQIRNFDESNGLQSNEFNTGAYTKLRDGRFVFGGLNGVNVFHPSEISNNPEVPVVYINEFKVFENPLQTKEDICFLDKVDLRHFENSISLSFSTLGFSLPGKIKYQYKLEGYDKEWINTTDRNYVSYTNLNSGKYEFQVRCANADGIWSDDYTRLQITIATPFYKTWWFILASVLLVVQLIYMIYKNKINQIREKEAIRIQYTKELAEVEMKALRAQINPHFLFNSLNSINNFILRNDTKLASRYLVKFSQLVRNILNNSSATFINLEEELQTIELYMIIEGMRFSNQFSYQIVLSPEIQPGSIRIPSLLLQPYVENAIWHGLLHKDGEKNIVISVKRNDQQYICIEIEDNGVGREKARQLESKTKKHKSFGMALGESRLRLMNLGSTPQSSVEVVDLHNVDGEATGTKIIITLFDAKFNQSILNQ
jgi:ligand-binding sensor domain-containing protein